MRSPRFIKSVSWLVPARLFYTICQWAMLGAVTRTGSLDTVGAYGLAIGVVTLTFRCFEFGMGDAINIDHDRETSDRDYLFLRNLFCAIATVICIGIALSLYGFTLTGTATIAMSFPKAVESQSVVRYAFFRRDDKIHLMAQSLILRGLLGTAAFAAVLFAGGMLEMAILALGMVWLIIAILFDDKHTLSHTPMDHTASSVDANVPSGRLSLAENVTKSLALGTKLFPLAIAGVCAYATGVLPRMLLEHYQDLATVGIFTALFYPFQAGSMIFGAVETIQIGPLSKHLQAGNVRLAMRSFGALLGVVGIGTAAGLLFVWLAGSTFLGFVYGPVYQDYAVSFLLLALAWAPRYLGSAIKCNVVGMRMFQAAFLPQLAMLVVGIVVGFLTIPTMGLAGGIITIAAAHIAFLILTIITACYAIRLSMLNSLTDKAQLVQKK